MLAALLPLLIATEETSLPDLFPAPANASFAGGCLALSPSFHIRVPQSGDAAGSLLERAASRYEAIVRSDARTPSAYCTCAGARPLPQISSLVVSVPDAALRAAATPAIGDDEAYELRVGTGVSTLTASSVWGAVRGLETLSQLVVADAKGAAADGIVCAASVHVSDAPRFPHRGLMLDTGRRFLSVPQILATLDAMSYAKLNVLHWHLVDDPAFPLEVVSLPLLSGKGALNAPRKTHTYTPADVAAVVAAASDRGIRVIPELDSPGHATSWYRGYPHLATVCPNAAPAEYYNPPMDPTSPAVDSFLRTLWHEVGLAFPDRYVHIGGDEVWFECWAANVTIAKYMRDHSINSTAELQALFEAKVLAMNAADGKSSIMWQANSPGTRSYPKGVVVEVWDTNASAVNKTRSLLAAGYDVIFTNVQWYLNENGASDYLGDVDNWRDVYLVEPSPSSPPAEERARGVPAEGRVIGGEACTWGSFTDEANFMGVTFPRALAVAERLWSQQAVRDVDSAVARASALRCRMAARGLAIPPVRSAWDGSHGKAAIPATVHGVGDFCPTPPPFHYKPPGSSS